MGRQQNPIECQPTLSHRDYKTHTITSELGSVAGGSELSHFPQEMVKIAHRSSHNSPR